MLGRALEGESMRICGASRRCSFGFVSGFVGKTGIPSFKKWPHRLAHIVNLFWAQKGKPCMVHYS